MTRSATLPQSPPPRPFRPWWLRGWLGRLLRSEKRLLTCVAIALVLHLPALPSVKGLLDLLHGDDDETEDLGEAIVPIELDIEGPGEEAPHVPVEPEPQKVPEPEPTEPAPVPEIKDAGPPDVGVPDAAPPDAAPPDAAPPPDADPPDAKPEPKKPGSPLDDFPVAKQLNKNPNNVQVVFVGAELRKHPLGQKLGTLLPTHPQWKDFFEGTKIDPVKDIDAMVLTGPQFRVTDQVIVIMQFADPARLKPAVQTLLDRSEPKGTWLEDVPVEAALGEANTFGRMLAIVPDKRLLYVIPSPYPSEGRKKKLDKIHRLEPSLAAAHKRAKAQLDRVQKAKFKDYAKAGYAIDAFMVEPWKLISKTGTYKAPLIGEVEILPKTLVSGRVTVRLQPAGGAELEIVLVSTDEEQAKADAASMNAIWPTARALASAVYDFELPDGTFTAEGVEVRAKAVIGDDVLAKAFELAEKQIAELKKKLGDKQVH